MINISNLSNHKEPADSKETVISKETRDGGDLMVDLAAAELILNSKGLIKSVYEVAANDISDIAQKCSEPFASKALVSLETILKTKELDYFAYSAAANAISGIAQKCSEPLASKALFCLETILKTKELYYFAYSAAAGAISDIVKKCSEPLASKAIFSLGIPSDSHILAASVSFGAFLSPH